MSPQNQSTGSLFESPQFEPTRAAALARIAAVKPAAYARTRNHIEGDVTRLSPYLTHGLISLRAVLAGVLQHSPEAAAMPIDHKFVYELAWREYFHHVWHHEGDGIFDSLHEGVLPEGEYAPQMPADVRAAQTGIPAIDTAVRTLYTTGYLHNHARMWLASYVVHLRKVHWCAGANWMFGHLLDGDLASNHLSWQWVAATGSSKPYLFNAENVARYAPPEWHSAGTLIDTTYEELEAMARDSRRKGTWRSSARESIISTEPPLQAQAPRCGMLPDAALVQGRNVVLLHPWCLHVPSAVSNASNTQQPLRIGLLVDECHQRLPWSAQRWQFVVAAMQSESEVIWQGSAATLKAALAGAASWSLQADPHLGPALADWPQETVPTLFAWPEQRCASFSKFWSRTTRGLQYARHLLERNANSMQLTLSHPFIS